MTAVFLKMLEMSARAFWVILAVMVLRALMKGAPKKYAYCLWSVVGFRLCCPVSFRSVFSLFSLGEQVGMPALTSEYVPVEAGPSVGPAVEQLTRTGYTLPQTESFSAAAGAFQGWIDVTAILWCAGVLLLAGIGLLRYVRLNQRLRSAIRLEPGVYQTEYAGTAFVMGFVRPCIYLPFGLQPASMGYILAHERYHIRRMDHIVKLFAYLLLAIHWMNPLCWVAFFLMNHDMEMSCDEAVLAEAENAQSAYSAALLDAALIGRPAASDPPAFGAFEVKARIRNALRWKKPTTWMTAAAAVLCITALLFLAANPVSKQGEMWNAAYQVAAVEYEAPQYSFTYTPETAPGYWIGSDCSLWVCGGGQEGWERLGQMKEAPLTAQRFDQAFYLETDNAWKIGSPEAFRQDNRRAWRLSAGGIRYDLMEQRNGTLYLAYGYEEEENGNSLQSEHIRWLFRLERTEETARCCEEVHWGSKLTLAIT